MNRQQRREQERQIRRMAARGIPDQPEELVPALPVSFALPAEKAIKLAMPEAEAFDALLAHKATPQQFGIVECICEVGIRAIRKAKDAPHCRHLDPEALEQALRDFERAGHALKRAKDRHDRTGVYGLDAVDRQCLIELRDWNAALNSPGHIPRAIWFAALRDGAFHRGGVKLRAWEALQ